MSISIGLPRMHKEPGERRDFLPELVSFLDRKGAAEIVIEHGYGKGMEIPEEAYSKASTKVRFADYETCLKQDLVLVVRCPDEDVFERLRPGTILLTMLHFPTRPGRVARLMKAKVAGISLDGLADDSGVRLIENLRSVGWNGAREAFLEMKRRRPDFDDPSRASIKVTVLGAGAVGAHAVAASIRYGDPALRDELSKKGVPGVEVTVVDYDLTCFEEYMRARLSRTDLLIDATNRPDATRPVIPNSWLASMPEDAVVLDLSVDPYDFESDPPQVKGVEGIPGGSLDQWIFPVDDPAWGKIDPRIDTRARRLALSCYSWPGIYPKKCMELYGEQVAPVLGVLLNRKVEELDTSSESPVERSVARAEVSRWLAAQDGSNED